MSTGAPTCRVCGVAHWAREPHVFKGEKAVPVKQSVRQPVKQAKADPAPDAPKPTRAEYLKTYMRSYMQKRRAAKG